MIDQEKLRLKAKQALVTVDMIAEASNLSYHYVSRWIKGQDIGIESCIKIKDGLKQLKK